jgi:CHAT domain-containing protein/Tfp pilus assembly protein PilF
MAYASVSTPLLQLAQKTRYTKEIYEPAQDNNPLEPNKPVEREMTGGEAHYYEVMMLSGQYLYVVVDQRGIDVAVSLLGPDDNKLIEVDSPNGAHGIEPLSFVAEITGVYRLKISSLEKGVAGHYEVKIKELRPATAQDKGRFTAEKAFMEGEHLLAQGTPESSQKSIKKFEQSLSLFQSVGDHYKEALALAHMGNAYNSLGEKQKAVEYYTQALPLVRKVGIASNEAIIINNIGAVYYSSGEKQKALEFFNRALELRRSIGDRSGEATTLSNLGAVYYDLGQKQRSLDFYLSALKLFRNAKDISGEVIILNNISQIYDDLGEKTKALDLLTQALALTRELKDLATEATTLFNLGKINYGLGENQKALEFYLRALPLTKSSSNSIVEAKILNNIGKVYDDLGNKQRAIDYYTQALNLSHTAGDTYTESSALNNVGLIFASLGESQKALDLYKQALALSRLIKDRQTEGHILINIGALYRLLKNYPMAVDTNQQALAIARAIADSVMEANALNSLGELYILTGNNQRALEHYNTALAIRQKIGDREGAARTLEDLGSIYENLGNLEQALDSYLKSIEILEEIRSATHLEKFKIAYAQQSADIYQRTILLFMRLNQFVKAFEISESARARSFLDELVNKNSGTNSPINTPVIQREQQLRSQISDLELKLKEERAKPTSQLNPGLINSLETKLATMQRDYEDLLTTLKLIHPEYVSLRNANSLKLIDIQKLLDKDTTLLSYYVTPQKTLIFTITKDSFRAVEIPLTEKELTMAISEFRSFSSLRDIPQKFKRLYEQLITPIRSYLNTPVVGIVPFGVLQYLPFAALTNGQHYLGDEFALFYLPSGSTLAFIPKKMGSMDKQLFAIAQDKVEGFVTLHYAQQEIRRITQLYNASVFLGSEATETALREYAGDYTFLHIAAPFQLNINNPLFSSLLLAPDNRNDGKLEVQEIYELNLRKTNLVVLSGPQTQLGKQTGGDEIVGLSRAFIYAGASSVIASLWNVDDKSTMELMLSFYNQLKRGKSKADALRAAQIEVRIKYPNPYYWAAFVLTGAPGTDFTPELNTMVKSPPVVEQEPREQTRFPPTIPKVATSTAPSPGNLVVAGEEVLYTYEFKQPDFAVHHILVEHDASGRGRVSFERKGNPEVIIEPLELSAAALARIHALWDSLRFLESEEDYQSNRQFPHLGTVRLHMARGKRERTAEFNWTSNREAAALASEYRRAADQTIFIFDITVARENHPLDAPKLMDHLDYLLSRDGLSDPRQLIPLLRDLNADERIPFIARNHAGRLLKKIEK